MLALYERVLKYRKTAAGAPVRDGRCSACQILLRPQTVNELRRNEIIYQCESCQRILYYQDAPQAAARGPPPLPIRRPAPRSSPPVIVNIDGGSRGNPCPAGYGVRSTDAHGHIVAEFGEAIGVATNNVAEYRGLLAALRHAKEHGYTNLTVRSDSLLLVSQIRGEYKVKSPGLQALHGEARRLVWEIGRVRFEHVRREANADADRLANQAMDGKKSSQDGRTQ